MRCLQLSAVLLLITSTQHPESSLLNKHEGKQFAEKWPFAVYYVNVKSFILRFLRLGHVSLSPFL